MKSLIINRLFYKNFLNYKLYNFDSKKKVLKKSNIENFSFLPKNYNLSYNFKNILIEPYLLNQNLKLIKNNKSVSFLIKPCHLNYNLGMFFITRKYVMKKILVKNNKNLKKNKK